MDSAKILLKIQPAVIQPSVYGAPTLQTDDRRPTDLLLHNANVT